MNYRKALAACGLMLGLTFSASALGADLKVATDTSVVPFEYEENGKMVGFDIDIWDAIAGHMGVTYKLQSMDFNGIIPALQTGSIDVALAAMTIRAKREEVIDFSMPYYDSGLMLMVKSDNTSINGIGDIKGRVIGAKTGTTGADYAATLGASEVRLYPNMDSAYLDVRTGRIDAAIHDTPNIQYYIKVAGDGEVKAVGPNLAAQKYGIAMTQGSQYRDAINIALLTMMENGEYDKIYSKWFGKE